MCSEIDTEMMEENDDVMYLTDEEGKDHPFALLDYIEYNDKEYCIIQDLEDEEHNDEAIVMEVSQDGEENDVFTSVDDDEIADAVFDFYLQSLED